MMLEQMPQDDALVEAIELDAEGGEVQLFGVERDNLIFDITGIKPYPHDPNERTAKGEVRTWLQDIQTGNPNVRMQAQERLIAWRLRWIYDFAFRPEVQQRSDFPLRDVMQAGCMAVIEAASEADLLSSQPVSVFSLEIRRRMERHMTMGKLTPTIGKMGYPLYNVQESGKALLIDQTEIVEEKELVELSGEDPSSAELYPEYSVGRRGAEWLFRYGGLTHKMRKVLRLRYGMPDEVFDAPALKDSNLKRAARQLSSSRATSHASLTFEEVADVLGANSRQSVALLEDDGLKRLRKRLEESPEPFTTLRPDVQIGIIEEALAEMTAEWITRREDWFNEIAAKQMKGEVAFVQGRLLQRPLPAPLQRYLKESNSRNPGIKHYSAKLQTALRQSKGYAADEDNEE